jgi:hypothetical protein
MSPGLLGFAKWLAAYAAASFAAGAALSFYFWIGEVAVQRPLGFYIPNGTELRLYLLSPLFIMVFALPSVALFLGLPEMLGLRPRPLLWTMLGGVAAFCSALLTRISSTLSFGEIIRDMFQPPTLDLTGSLVFSGMVGGYTLAILRRNWLK